MASQPQLPVEPLCLHVMVMSAANLFKKDLFGLCDPYVKVTLKRKSKGLVTEQTKKKKKTLNPDWKEVFVFKDINLSDDSLLFEVFDENKLTRDNFLGKIHFKLHHIPIEMKKIDIRQYERSATYPLKPRSHKSRVSGNLTVKFLYHNTPPSRMGSATLMGELNLASLVEGSTGRSSPRAPERNGSPALTTGNPEQSMTRQESTMDMDAEDDPLPEGWEERQDANGRTFFVDHVNRRTQWSRPTRSADEGAGQRRAQMEADRRRMMAQTLARRNPGMSGAESMLDLTINNGTRNGSPSGSRNSVAVSTPSERVNARSPVPSSDRSPISSRSSSSSSVSALGTQNNGVPPTSRNSIAVVSPAAIPPPLPPRNAVIPRLPPPPSRSMSNTSLNVPRQQTSSRPATPSSPAAVPPANISINLSPPPTASLSPSSQAEPLPEGWEMRLAANGRPFYIDHRSRKTQWHRPTVSTLSTQRPRPQSAISLPGSLHLSSPSPNTSMTTPTSNITAATTTLPSQTTPSQAGTMPSQPTATASQPTTAEDLGPLPPGWEMRALNDGSGKFFYIEHATRSTQWEDPRIQLKKKQQQQRTTASTPNTPYSRDYKLKYENLRKHFQNTKPNDLPRVFEIPIRRQTLFEDSHRAVMSCKNKDHLKARLWVKFDGEKGLDYGGVSREWFFLLSHEMFNPYYGLFEYAASDNYTLQVNPESGFCNENHLEYFRFIGRILAMAIYHQRLIDAFFVRPFYKMLSGKKITLGDMEMVDTEFYNSIKYILENDPEPLCLTFTANREFVGQVEEVELKPGGGDIEVTESNKKEYIDLLMKWRFENRITKQMEALKKGFNDVISIKHLAPFDAQEIEYLMCGIGEINIDDWRKHTVYAAGYKSTDDVIVWFWKAVTNFDSELRARLLQFVTGTSKVPMNGFAELQGSNGPQKFCIKKLGEPSSLPRSHTCFNRIDLPPYRSYHELKEKLRVAIENTEGFEGVD